MIWDESSYALRVQHFSAGLLKGYKRLVCVISFYCNHKCKKVNIIIIICHAYSSCFLPSLRFLLHFTGCSREMSEVQATVEAGVFSAYGLTEVHVDEDLPEELNGMPFDRLGPRILHIVSIITNTI